MYKMLKQHPDVWLPDEKEIMFFSHHYEKGVDWYAQFFRQHEGNRLVGEVCPTYFSVKDGAARIAKHVPAAKIIVTLREPVAQVYSLYNLTVTRGKKKGTIMQAIKEEDFFLNNVLYYTHLMRFLEYYNRENILVLFYEDMKADHKAYLDSIYEFLDISSYYPDSMTERVNYARKPKSRFLEKIISEFGDFLRKTGLIQIKSMLNRLGIVERIRKMNTEVTQQEEMPTEFVECVQNHVREDRRNLEKWLGRRLDIWDLE